MVKRFQNAYNQKGYDNVGYKWSAYLISCFKKAPEKDNIKQAENEKRSANSKEIRIHQSICPVYGRLRKKRHPDK